MALADATVRVILDVSRFERDLQSKVESAARRAGQSFEREFRRSAAPAARGFVDEFRTEMNNSMATVGDRAGRRLSQRLRSRAALGARETGRLIGDRLRGGLLGTANQTGAQFGVALRNAAVQPLGGQVGRTFARALFDALSQARVGNAVSRALDRSADEDSITSSARTIASNFVSALGSALSAAMPGGRGLLGAAISGLVTEGVQLAAAIAPALQAVGLIPGAMAIAGAAVSTLMVAFEGFGAAVSAAASGDAEELAEALENLAPAAADVVTEIGAITPRLRELRMEVQQAFFSQLTGDMTRLGQVLVGPVQRGMTGTATAAGRMASSLASVVAEARNARVIEQVFGSTTRFFERLAAPLSRMTQGMFDWVNATLPAFDRLSASLGAAVDRFADFLAVSARSGQALTWVNEAIATFGQLWQVVRNLTGLLGDIFSVANEASGGYLVTLNRALVATRQFLSVGEGRAALVDIFAGLHQVVAALGAPLRELVLQLGGVARIAGDVAESLSSGVTSAIRGIGQGLQNAGPGLTRFADAISDLLSDIGPSLATLGAAFGRLLDGIAPLAAVVGVVVRAGIGLIDLFSRLPTGILAAVAAFVALRALGVPALMTSIWNTSQNVFNQMRTGSGTIGTVTAAYQAQLAQLQALRVQQQQLNVTLGAAGPGAGVFAGALGGIVDRASAAGTAVGGFAGAARGLVGMLGGPLGLLLTAASIGIGLFAAANEKSARATREHADYVQSLAQSLDRETGAITANTLETVRNNAEKNGLLQKARELGISSSNLIGALAGESNAMRATRDELAARARSLIENSDAYKELVRQGAPAAHSLDVLTQAALGNRTEFDKMFALIGEPGTNPLPSLANDALGAAGGMDQLAGALNGAGGDMEAARKQFADFQKALRDTVQNSTAFGQALQRMADTASTAEERTRALREALRALEGGTQTVTEAQVAQYDSLRNIEERIAAINEQYGQGAGRAQEFGGAIFAANGQIDASAKGVSELTKSARDLNDRLADVSAAAADQARRTGDWATAQQTIAGAYAANRQRLVELATAMGFGAQEAERFADQVLRTPQQVVATLSLVGAPQALQQLAEVQLLLQQLQPGQPKVIYMRALTEDATKALEGLGFQVERLSTGEFKITPRTEEALRAIEGLKISIDQTSGTIRLDADNEPAKAKIGEIGKLLTASATTKVEVDGKTAYATVDGLMVYIDSQTGQIKIGALPKDAQDQTAALKDWINQQTGRVKVDADTAPARGSFGGMMEFISNTTATGPTVQGNFAPAYAGVNGLVGAINASYSAVPVGANTGPAFGAVGGLVSWIRTNSANVGVGALVSGAIAQVDALVRYINSRVGTVTVRTNSEGGVLAAEGGIASFYRHGGFHSMRPMPANRAEIVPPRVMRVIGDRPSGDEAFIPLINTARSHAIFRAAGQRLGYDVAPRNTRQGNSYTTTVEAGAVVVNAPYSDPRLVARAVVNELTREAVI